MNDVMQTCKQETSDTPESEGSGDFQDGNTEEDQTSDGETGMPPIESGVPPIVLF